MALGDGITWDETAPTDATSAVTIDDHNRDVRKGVRSRMAFEHEWPASQSATSEAGKHKFITFQSQGSKPVLSGTQIGAIYSSVDSLFFERSNGDVVQITTGTGVVADSAVVMFLTGNQTAAGTKTFSSVILADSGLNCGGSSINNALLGVSNSGAELISAGESFTVTAGWYVTGIEAHPDGTIKNLHFAKV